MAKKTFTPEQIVAKLRQIEVLVSQGKTVPLACKDLQKENAQLRRAVADLTIESRF
jgi:hypothetical protein